MAITCPSCAAQNPEGKRFCGDCGQPIVAACPTCGAELQPGKRFCGDCGAEIAASIAAVTSSAMAPVPSPKRIAERRLTTILFGDLVGYTTLSESRDPEDMRELLSKYFAMATKVVSRYGGTIEKFIGDAVMAVWGVPVAHEDDAERAVRAGLDLITEIAVLAAETGVDELNMRVGVLCGEVAVTLGAVGEGMVAGDAVNTAARIQAAAEPGQVWVDETTRSLTSAAVTYADVGAHQLKGKSEPVHLYRAAQVVAAVGGAQRVDGLEAPFVGRDHELRLVKELFHGAVAERRARLVAVFGLAGVGKTRLGWEFEKYVDGITEQVPWHRGRVLSYGDGVSFWAIAEMVRSRLGILDGDAPSLAATKLLTALTQYVPDADERSWLQPRLSALLGLTVTGDGPAPFVRDDLFSAWATFFERLSGGNECVVLLIDDMQYADPDLLDFLSYLVDTARYPLFVVTLARPELLESRRDWGSGRRATPIHLEPLGEPVMTEIVDALVHGLPESARRSLVDAAGGIPLYALEMVRALIDRDAVIPRGGQYVVADNAGELLDQSAFDAPPSLHALIAARLDALSAPERQVLQDATVHGVAFSRAGLEFVSDVPDLDSVLEELVRKEIFEVHTDRFSAERGQYRFVQALVRSVAYETLSRRDRKTRHLKVARFLEETNDGDEIAAVVARHYLDAADNAPGDDDNQELVRLGVDQLERAARRAELVGSPEEALRHYTVALTRDLTDADRARILEGVTVASQVTTRTDDALAYGGQARALYESLGRPVDAARTVAMMGEVLFALGDMQGTVDLVRPVYDSLVGQPDADTALLPLASVLARVLCTLRDPEGPRFNDRAASLAEAQQDWARVATHLNMQGVLLGEQGRTTGAVALWRAAVELARREHRPRSTITPLANLCAIDKNRDLDQALAAGREAVAASLQAGARDMLQICAAPLLHACWLSGSWDEIESLHTEYLEDLRGYSLGLCQVRTVVHLVRSARGETVDFELVVPETDEGSSFVYNAAWMAALIAEACGDAPSAAREYIRSLTESYRIAGLDDDFGIILPLAVESAIAAGEPEQAAGLLDFVPKDSPGSTTPLLRAEVPFLRALVAIATGRDDETIDADLETATDALRGFGARYYLARTLLERARRLMERSDYEQAEPLRQEATQLFASLRATRWVEEAGNLSLTH